MSNGDKITLKTIAEAMGVSEMTVSRAMRGAGRMGLETRQRIIMKAKELGYRPQFHAKLLRSGERKGSVGLVQAIGHELNFLSHNCMRGIHEELLQHDLPLVSGVIPDELLVSPDGFPTILREWIADGLLINYLAYCPPEFIEILERFRVPTIWMNVKREFDCVHPDDFGGAQAATNALLSLGHRKIAFAIFNDSKHYSLEERSSGYLRAMRDASLPPEILRLGELGSHPLCAWRKKEAFAAWGASRRGKMPTAVVACYDDGEIIIEAARDLGLEVPEDLSVVSFAAVDKESSTTMCSYMQIPFYDLGRMAVRTLLEKMDRPEVSIKSRAVPYPPLVPGTVAASPRR